MTFTVMTFAPVQGFIERSRKLRDLYGGSFILSHLARRLCEAGQQVLGQAALVSPALIHVTQGTPNQIVLAGDFPQAQGRQVLQHTWRQVVQACREWIEDQLPEFTYTWRRHWNAWAEHAWEFFWGQGATITQARQAINRVKRCRDWVAVNWQGESSTLSGADGIAWPGMGRQQDSRDDDREIRHFYGRLQALLGEAFVEETEQLSIPELIKRLVTYYPVAQRLGVQREVPESFQEIPKQQRALWFAGDGDQIGQYLRRLQDQGEKEAQALHRFSQAMLRWGQAHLKPAVDERIGRVIYAGGDDFLGVLYTTDTWQFSPRQALDWLSQTFPRIWQAHGQGITVSVGAVLASNQVPQREILQQVREAEKSAKRQGRNRLALRVLFNSGNVIEWVCPWTFLQPLFQSYRDREGQQNWTHLYNDVATLQARRGLDSDAVALALFEVYFGEANRRILEQHLPAYLGQQRLGEWVSNLARVGFQLCSDT